MRDRFKKYGRRFCSDVPVWVAKIQILLGAAASSLGTVAAISWPGKAAVIGSVCGYGAAGCTALAVGLQFMEKAINILETPAPQAQVTEPNNPTA